MTDASVTSAPEALACPYPPSQPEASPWDQACYAFLIEKGNRSGSRRTVESYGRMLWRLFAETTPDRVRPADVLAYAHGIGLSGRPPSAITIGARIACLSSYYRFLIRMGLVAEPHDRLVPGSRRRSCSVCWSDLVPRQPARSWTDWYVVPARPAVAAASAIARGYEIIELVGADPPGDAIVNRFVAWFSDLRSCLSGLRTSASRRARS